MVFVKNVGFWLDDQKVGVEIVNLGFDGVFGVFIDGYQNDDGCDVDNDVEYGQGIVQEIDLQCDQGYVNGCEQVYDWFFMIRLFWKISWCLV